MKMIFKQSGLIQIYQIMDTIMSKKSLHNSYSNFKYAWVKTSNHVFYMKISLRGHDICTYRFDDVHHNISVATFILSSDIAFHHIDFCRCLCKWKRSSLNVKMLNLLCTPKNVSLLKLNFVFGSLAFSHVDFCCLSKWIRSSLNVKINQSDAKKYVTLNFFAFKFVIFHT